MAKQIPFASLRGTTATLRVTPTTSRSLLNAMNSQTMGILAGWEHPAFIYGGAEKVSAEDPNLGRQAIEVPRKLDRVWK